MNSVSVEDTPINVDGCIIEPPQHVKYLLLTLSSVVNSSQIEYFRGAFISFAKGNPLYHNHIDEGFAYRYPLVQYKRIGGHGAVLLIGDAVNTVGSLLDNSSQQLLLGDRSVPCEIQRIVPGNRIVQVWNDSFTYHLRRWLPFNKANYERYLHCQQEEDRLTLLQRMLTGNILSMCKGLGITLHERIETSITQIEAVHKVRFKNTQLLEFDIVFQCNVSIPDYFGLGKAVSHGHGICVRSKKKTIE